MSGAGKTTLLDEMSRRGHETIDTDHAGWTLPDGKWDEARMAAMLAGRKQVVVSGTVQNQGRFYDRFDHVVLLSAPLGTLLDRLETRSNNPYGKTAEHRGEVERYVAEVEPLLRRGATVELDGRRPVADLADAVEELLGVPVKNRHHDEMQNLASSVTLRPVDDANREEIVALAVTPGQEQFVDGVAASLREAAAAPRARPWYRAIYARETPVGFLMLADGAEPGNGVIPWPYYLWRMLIDGRYQGRGYGRAALDLVVAHLRERPDADALITSIVPGDGSPYGFYLRFGFEPTGDFFDHETVLALRLKNEG